MNRVVSAWILISVAASVAGWLLSAFHALSATGYLVFLGVAGGLFGLAYRQGTLGVTRGAPALAGFRKLRQRFRRPLPLAFLGLALLAFAGGLLYPTNNYDELTYRLPRVLHWLGEGRWHWIHAPDARFNTRATGFEFLTAPLLALCRSDRPFFLINAISYVLFPGLVYSVAIRLGVRKRTAWSWMWVLPAGFSFVLQAGSTANDMFACVYVLSAIGFALRARETRRPADLWLSILSAALMTGAKGSNLPLLLPSAVACWPAVRLLLERPAASVAILATGALVSFLPTAVCNVRHCGDWSGTVLEASSYKLANPLAGLAGNGVVLTLDSLTPPVLPLPQTVADRVVHLLPARFIEMYNSHFAFKFKLFTGIMTEDGAGLGLGIGLLLAVSALTAAGLRLRRGVGDGCDTPGPQRRFQAVLMVSIAVAFLAFCAKAGMGQIGRLSAPYYPLLALIVLRAPAQEFIVRRRWWRCGAGLAFLLAGTAVILSPARPLMPAQTMVAWLQNHHVRNPFLERARASYEAFACRNDALAPLRTRIPDQAGVLGLVSAGNDIEPSLWRPFGKRRVVHFLPCDSAATLHQVCVQYVVVSAEALAARQQSWADWLRVNNAEETAQLTLTRTFPPYQPYDWYVARLRP